MKVFKYAFTFALVGCAYFFPISRYYPGLDESIYEGVRLSIMMLAFFIVAITPLIRSLNMLQNKSLFEYNHIVVLSTFIFIAMGKYLDAILVMAIYSIYFDLSYSLIDSARMDIIKRFDLGTDTASVQIENTRAKVDASQIEKGMNIVVLPGEKVPLDGYVVKGMAHVDLSTYSGEKSAMSVVPGSFVKSGVTVIDEKIEIEVKNDKKSCFTTRLYENIKTADLDISRTEDNAITLSIVFMVFLSLFAIGIIFLVPATRGFKGLDKWAVKGLSVMLMTCGITISSTAGISGLVGMYKCFKNGVYVKNEDTLNKLARIRAIVLDVEMASNRFASKAIMIAKSYGISKYAILSDANADEVKRVGSLAGIDIETCYGGLTMPEMFERLKSMDDFSPQLMFIGDYKTDSVMISRASVGAACGMIESNDDFMDFNSASVIAMKDDPVALVENIKVAYEQEKINEGNIMLAVLYKLVAIGLIIAGILPITTALIVEVLLEIILIIRSTKI